MHNMVQNDCETNMFLIYIINGYYIICGGRNMRLKWYNNILGKSNMAIQIAKHCILHHTDYVVRISLKSQYVYNINKIIHSFRI